jgi:hypothetical protein
MVEAYRYVETYYRYLLQQRALQEDDDSDGVVDPFDNKNNNAAVEDPVKNSETQATDIITENGEGVELALPSSSGSNNNSNDADLSIFLLKAPKPPEDMVHQCRAVADWLNFKLLQSGFVSHTEGGLLAASSQWQKHAQAFCSPRRSFVCSRQDKNNQNPWVDWSFVAHQRVVVSQLLERHPPRALGDLGNDFDEVLLRCSPWRTYEAAAEALLKLGAEVQKAAGQLEGGGGGGHKGAEKVDEMRTRYVGGLDNEGYTPKLQEEVKINHRGKRIILLWSKWKLKLPWSLIHHFLIILGHDRKSP